MYKKTTDNGSHNSKDTSNNDNSDNINCNDNDAIRTHRAKKQKRNVYVRTLK